MKWQIAPHLVPLTNTDGSRTILAGESMTHVIDDPSQLRIIKALPVDVPPEELLRIGILSPVLDESDVASAAFWTSSGLPAAPALATDVRVHAESSSGANILRKALAAAGFNLESKPQLDIIVVDDYMSPFLAEVNHERRLRRAPWLPVKLIGHTMWLGPRFSGGSDGPCWACLAHRIRENRWALGTVLGQGPETMPTEPSITVTPLTLSLAASVAAIVLGNWARGGTTWDLANHVVTFDMRPMSLSVHWVQKRPQCRVCGDANAQETGSRELLRLVSPITGIVPKLVRTETPQQGFFHAKAEVLAPCAEHVSRAVLRPTVSIGKGVTRDAAERTCLAEAVERYSIIFQGNEPEVEAAGVAFEHPHIPLQDLNRFSERQYADRDYINAMDDDRATVPEKLSPDQSIHWTLGHYLDESRGPVYVPSCYCYLWHPERQFCPADSNGCAAGETLEDATFRALLEVIERDAAAIWWYNRVPRPRVPVKAFDSPELSFIHAELEKSGRCVYLLDIRADLPCHVLAAISVLADGSQILFGLGCHYDAHEAARRAYAELSQVTFWIGENRERLKGPWQRWLAHTTLESEPFLAGVDQIRSFDDSMAPDSLDGMIRELDVLGFRPVVVNLSRPDLPLKVVRTAVPGMCHFWPRLGSERLYDVPVKLGWRAERLREQDLNPIACLL